MCDRRHLSSSDLNRISDNLEEQLSNKYKFHIIPYTEQWQKSAKFSKEYKVIRKYRNTDKAALHDAIALMYVKEKRGNKIIKNFEKVNCWFVNNSITHENENIDTEYNDLYNCETHQPEIIKVDDLLNILWLSNPTMGLTHDEVAKMGIASLVSYTLNSSLPKARIIKELDENIQKYREDNNITDKDVMNLSTRIVSRQIKDVQSLNDLARKDEIAFAAKVKEESMKQEKIEADRAHNFDKLFKTLQSQIKDLKGNQMQMQEKYGERMMQLNKKEKELIETDKSRKLENESLKADRHHLMTEKETLQKEKDEYVDKFHTLWMIENQKRKKQKNQFVDEKINKSKNKSTIIFVVSLIILLIILSSMCYYYIIADDDSIKAINNFCNFKPISSIIGICIVIVNYFTIKNFYNWHYNPTYEVNKLKLIKVPKDFEQICFDDYMKNIK